MPSPKSTSGEESAVVSELEAAEEKVQESPAGVGEVTVDREASNVLVREAISLPRSRSVLDIPIEFRTEGKRIEMNKQGNTQAIHVNVMRFARREGAESAAIGQAAYLRSMRDHLQTETGKALEALKTFGESAHAALRLKGMKKLSQWEPLESATIVKISEGPSTSLQLFDWACSHYLLTGQFPAKLPQEMLQILNRIPMHKGKSALEFIAEEKRSLKSAAKLYAERVAPLRAELKQHEGEKRMTEREDYTPPNFSGEQEPLDPNTVQWRVEPFYGGYYRQQLFRYDPQQQRIVAEPIEKVEFRLAETPDNLAEIKRYTFRGVFKPGEEHRIPFPEKGLPLPETLEPQGKFLLMRSQTGIFSLDERTSAAIREPTEYSFQFVIAGTVDNRIDDEPTEADLATIDGPLDDSAQTLLDTLKSNQFLSEADRARGVVLGIRKQFTYPEEEERQGMNERYAVAGSHLHPTMADLKLADCHWSNIRASDLGRRVAVPMRTPSGFFVSPHPDVDFAPIGGIGHAWSERWDSGLKQWIRMDATPPKQNEEEGEPSEKEEKREGNEQDMDVLPLSDDEAKELLNKLTGMAPAEREVADSLFVERTAVDPAEWKRVEEFIKAVNDIQVPQHFQIPETATLLTHFRDRLNALKGTLEREWQKLFCIICSKREIHRRAFRGPVRQSEGTRLKDTVTAYIDIVAGHPDPGGFELDATRKEQVIDVQSFHDDVIVDLTASMEKTDDLGNSMRLEQKKMILGSLSALSRLNEMLSDSRIRSKLRAPLSIQSALYSVQGGAELGTFTDLSRKSDESVEHWLTDLFRRLDHTVQGRGDLLSALKSYRGTVSADMQQDIASGSLKKMLTIFSDGMEELMQDQRGQSELLAIQKEIAELRQLGIVVQGIGFTKSAKAITVVCNDPKDAQAAVVVDDVSRAVTVRNTMLAKHLLEV